MAYDSTRMMDLLKESTDQHHRDAERRNLQRDMVQGRLPVERYRVWLGQMFLLHRALWDAICRSRRACSALAEIVCDEGLHVQHLRADLATLGTDADEVVPLPSTARALDVIGRTAEQDPFALLGYNYVLEGSMNGNRFIARALTATTGGSALSYLDPYGEEQRPVWMAYRERMNAAGFDAERTRGMITAAQDMFTFVAEMSDDVMEAPLPA